MQIKEISTKEISSGWNRANNDDDGVLPCRLCPRVVVVVGLLCFDDPYGYAVEPIVPYRSKVIFQTKRPRGFTPCADEKKWSPCIGMSLYMFVTLSSR